MLIYILLCVVSFLSFRICYLLFRSCPYFKTYYPIRSSVIKRKISNKVETVVVLGSGGHTTELLLIVSHLDPRQYSKHYIIASTDKRSFDKVMETESRLAKSDYDVCYIPRSREVQQSFLTSVFSTVYSLLVSLPIMFRIKPELVLCNGPGTCVPICLIALLLKTLFICDVKIIYVESICRVRSLSLSGKILRYITDEFLVQWPELNEMYPDTKYIGRL